MSENHLPDATYVDVEEEVESAPLMTEPSQADDHEVKNIVRTESKKLIRKFGGVDGVMRVLRTDRENGISGDPNDIEYRMKRFGSNDSNPYTKIYLVKDFHRCAVKAIRDPLIVILLMYTIVCICFGIKKHGVIGVWPERETHLLSIVSVVIFSAVTNLWPIEQNYVFSAAKNQVYSPQVDVVRNGVWVKIPVSEVVVGDIVYLKPGDQVPADGLCIDGHSLHLEDLTSDHLTKGSGVEAKSLRTNSARRVEVGEENPFLLAGNMVTAGYARIVVTAVEKSITEENGQPQHPQQQQQPPSQATWMTRRHVRELENLAYIIGRCGKAFAVLTFVCFLVRFCTQANDQESTNRDDKEADFVEFFIAVVGMMGTSAVIALTSSLEGLVLAVKSTLAYSMRSLLHQQVLIKRPSLCHRVASVDTICFNKIGTLTIDSLEVKEFWVGLNDIEEAPTDLIAPSVLELLHQAIGLNITQPRSSSTFATPLSPTERAIFDWATRELKMDKESLREGCTVLKIEPFNPVKKCSGVLISKKNDNTFHVHWKGAPDLILQRCSHYYGTGGKSIMFDRNTREMVKLTTKRMAEKGLRCIAFAHRKTSIEEHFNFNSARQQLTLIGLVGFDNLVRNEIATVVKDCQRAGINLKLVTGDSVLTAAALASRCGLLQQQPGDVVEGKQFRRFTTEERLEKVDRIRVLAGATPSDKSLLVQTLKEKGRVVAYVGGSVSDAQAIKEANVGLCFGPASEGRAEILKACSDIVIKDKKFLLVLEILKWGRGFYDSIQTYTQFLLTATSVDLVIDSAMTIFPNGFSFYHPVVEVSAQASVASGKLAIPVFQLLWVKFILGLVATLSVLIKQPSDDLMSEPPRDINEPLMTKNMLRNIIAQALYQIVVLLAIHFGGNSLLNLSYNEKTTLIFNTYVLCQVFMLMNAKLYDRKNIFQEMHSMKWFWGIIGFIIFLQVIMVEFWKSFAGTARLDSRQWGICFLIAAASTPISWLLR
ncbi:OLC1v1025372C1 [Oldenlandia corymbosa var. corymbosa]|uniref:OLC1v1025372C1 n=1 Tax=Oldenlandia corymbosa var. corymbosa TaxID=529605 RepID=A0AAV1C6Q3_OLDCO|nr:OLC1v1025372C1 [Oldenlandia corymbosa var. corymbosa]